MKIIKKQDHIRSVPDRWWRQYQNFTVALVNGKHPKDIHETLSVLPLNATEADVDRVIGIGGWVKLECHECGQDSDTVVEFNDDLICERCLRSAVEKLDQM